MSGWENAGLYTVWEGWVWLGKLVVVAFVGTLMHVHRPWRFPFRPLGSVGLLFACASYAVLTMLLAHMSAAITPGLADDYGWLLGPGYLGVAAVVFIAVAVAFVRDLIRVWGRGIGFRVSSALIYVPNLLAVGWIVGQVVRVREIIDQAPTGG